MPLQGRVYDIQKLHRKKTGWKVEQLYIYLSIMFEENHLVQKHAICHGYEAQYLFE